MADTLVRVTLANVSGVGADSYVNDFVFSGSVALTALVTSVQAFYNSGTTGTILAEVIGAVVSRTANACYIDTYDLTGHLDGSPHGSPTSHTAFTLTPSLSSGITQLPYQDCLVLSTRANYGTALERGPTASMPTPESAQDDGAPATHMGSTRPRASLRGRLYIGPLNSAALDGNGRTASGAGGTSRLKIQAPALLAAQPSWSVWSRRTASTHPIVQGWIDDEAGVRRTRRTKIAGKVAWP